MQKIALTLLAVAPLAFSVIPASAMTIGAMPKPSATPTVTLVRDGCGIGYNRGPMGYCRPNSFQRSVVAPYLGGACPPTYHVGPFGQRCRSDY